MILNEIDEQLEKATVGIEPIDKKIQQALSKMACEKSPGLNGVPTETFKNLDKYGMVEVFVSSLNWEIFLIQTSNRELPLVILLIN